MLAEFVLVVLLVVVGFFVLGVCILGLSPAIQGIFTIMDADAKVTSFISMPFFKSVLPITIFMCIVLLLGYLFIYSLKKEPQGAYYG